MSFFEWVRRSLSRTRSTIVRSVVVVPLAALIVLVLVQLPSPSAQEKQKEDKRDKQAKDLAEQYMKALKAEDIEATMKLIDVPFCLDGVVNIKERDKIKERFLEAFEQKELDRLEYKIKAVYSFGEVSKKLREKHRKLLEEVLDKTDRIVYVAFQEDGATIAVRFREGNAKVVGFLD